MHITAPRVLGLLMFLGLIGYAFYLAPELDGAGSAPPASSRSASSHVPAHRAPVAPAAPAAAVLAPTPAPAQATPPPAPFSRAE